MRMHIYTYTDNPRKGGYCHARSLCHWCFLPLDTTCYPEALPGWQGEETGKGMCCELDYELLQAIEEQGQKGLLTSG